MDKRDQTSGAESTAQEQDRDGATALASEAHESASGTLSERLETAVDQWYAGHHNRGVRLGSPSINADDLAALKAALLSVASTSQE